MMRHPARCSDGGIEEQVAAREIDRQLGLISLAKPPRPFQAMVTSRKARNPADNATATKPSSLKRRSRG